MTNEKTTLYEQETSSTDGDATILKNMRHAFMLYAYLPLSIAYMEVLLRLLCGYAFWQGLPFALLFSVGSGFAISAVALIMPNPKISRIVAGALLGIHCAVFALQFFMFTTYRVFMSFETIFLGVSNVIGEFTGVFFSAIVSGIPAIICFFLPLAFFLLLTKKPRAQTAEGVKETVFKRAVRHIWNIRFTAGEKNQRIRCVALLAVLVCVFSIGGTVLLNISADDKAAYSAEYHFDSSSRRLGVLMGLGLDIRYGIFGHPFTDAAFFIDELPPAQPSDSAPSDAQEPPTVTQTPATHGNEQTDGNTAQESPSTEPSEPSETPEPPPPPPIEYGYNMLDIDFETIIGNERNSRINSINEYVSSLTGSRQSEYTGIFEGKNLILITAEAFTKQVVDPVMTPTLYRLVNKGFYFSDYYQPAWGGSTSSGEYSVLTGLAPVSGAKSILNAAGGNLSFTIGNKLMNLGYFSASYHNGSHTYYGRNNTHTHFGYSTFTARGNGMEGNIVSRWPASDLDMMEFSLPQYIDNQPFSAYYMTVSGHSLYSRSGNAMANKNWDAFPEQYGEMSNTIRAYMACNLELDYALQYIVSSLEEAGIADDTVIVISTDHYPYGLEKSEAWGNDRDFLSELYGFPVRTPADRDQNALIIWSGCLENEYEDLAVEISSPTFSLDILPTLCNLFGLEFDSRLLVGRDVFSDADALVFWLDRSWKTDLGFFYASRNEFTPSSDMELPEGYIDRIRNIVNNRINYSGAAISHNYFGVLFNSDGTLREVD